MAKNYNLSDKRVFYLSYFRDVPYIHFKDKGKNKTLSLTKDEFNTLLKNAEKIQMKMKKMKLENKNKRKQKSPPTDVEEEDSCDEAMSSDDD